VFSRIKSPITLVNISVNFILRVFEVANWHCTIVLVSYFMPWVSMTVGTVALKEHYTRLRKLTTLLNQFGKESRNWNREFRIRFCGARKMSRRSRVAELATATNNVQKCSSIAGNLVQNFLRNIFGEEMSKLEGFQRFDNPSRRLCRRLPYNRFGARRDSHSRKLK
jgi:hypothetical protein